MNHIFAMKTLTKLFLQSLTLSKSALGEGQRQHAAIASILSLIRIMATKENKNEQTLLKTLEKYTINSRKNIPDNSRIYHDRRHPHYHTRVEPCSTEASYCWISSGPADQIIRACTLAASAPTPLTYPITLTHSPMDVASDASVSSISSTFTVTTTLVPRG